MKQILQNPNPLLRECSSNVETSEIGTKKLDSLIVEMQAILSTAKDGIALAAPQIGIRKRIFVLSPKIYEYGYIKHGTLVYINPRITKRSTKKSQYFQGCLSVRNMFGNVRRSEKVTVEAIDENGKRFTRGASGLLAEVFQHEIDHFEGKLFIDDAKNIREIKPEDEPET